MHDNTNTKPPHPQLSPTSPGLAYSISIQSHTDYGPKIKMDFGIEISFMALSSEEAEMLSRGLHKLAKKLRGMEAQWDNERRGRSGV